MQPHSNSKTVRYTCSTSHSYLDIPIHFYNQFINTKWRSVCFSLYLWTFPLPVSASYSLFFPRSSLRVTATSFYGSFHTLEHPLSPWRLAPAHSPFSPLISVLVLTYTLSSTTNPLPHLPGSSTPPLVHSLKCCHHFRSRYRSYKTWVWYFIIMIPEFSFNRHPK